MEIYFKANIFKTSKMVGENLHGQMDRSMKDSLEMTFATAREHTDTQTARLGNSCG
jgi:hypothetical protein